jgi:hypothetical protein
MKVLFLLATVFLFFSCDKNSEVIYSGKRVIIKPKNAGIEDIDIIKWKVGMMRNITISRGVQIIVNFPTIDKKHLRFLVDKYGVDSWIVKVKRRGMMRNETMGYLYIPIILPGQKNSMRINQLSTGSFKVFYAASAVSSRFSRLPCPAFKHDYIVEKVEVARTSPLMRKLVVSPVEEQRILAKVEEFNYAHTIVNGGEELRGEYYLEIAFYNKERKVKLSNWIELDGLAKVLRERSVPLKGCENFKIPPRGKDENLYQKFNFGG